MSAIIKIPDVNTSNYDINNNDLLINKFKNIVYSDDENNFLRVFNNNLQSLPFSLFIPFIKNINEFKIKEITTVDYFTREELPIVNNNYSYEGCWIKYENIINYISDEFKELINILFKLYYKKRMYIGLDLNVTLYFEYIQNIM